MRIRKPDADISLTELKQIIQEHKEKGRELVAGMKILLSHAEKMEEYYSEWESRANEIQEAINNLSKEQGIPLGQIEEYDALTDMLGGLQ